MFLLCVSGFRFGCRVGSVDVEGALPSQCVVWADGVVFVDERGIWARMQTELLNTKRWKARVELSTAIFDWIEAFYNRTRRHSSLGNV